MAQNVSSDQLVIIRIEGMHCHKCEARVTQALSRIAGVHEVEVDFPSRQASVLYDPSKARPQALLDAVRTAGYQAADFMTNSASNKTAQWTQGR